MLFPALQGFSVRLFSFGRRLLEGTRRWIQARPRLARWVYPDRSAEADYREHNGRMFADFHEQERMLADQPRMAFYAAAIRRHIRPGDRVIDLGTGTGILAALASRQGAARVYAIDHSDILTHARTLAAANRIDRVTFVATHSSAFKADEPVDVILHEQMGDCLFDESMVANVTDLRDRLLKPGGLILPSAFELFCEPVKLKDNRVVPFIWELEVEGYDYACLEAERPREPWYYRIASCDLDLIDHFHCEPEPILSLDLHTVNEAELDFELAFGRTVLNPGRLDGYVIYFRTRVDDDLSLTTDPLDPNRATNWGFRILRTPRETLAAGDRLEIQLTVEHWAEPDSWRWHHETHRAVGV